MTGEHRWGGPRRCDAPLPGYYKGRREPLACNRLPHPEADPHVHLIPPPSTHEVRVPLSPLLHVEWRLLPSGAAYAINNSFHYDGGSLR